MFRSRQRTSSSMALIYMPISIFSTYKVFHRSASKTNLFYCGRHDGWLRGHKPVCDSDYNMATLVYLLVTVYSTVYPYAGIVLVSGRVMYRAIVKFYVQGPIERWWGKFLSTTATNKNIRAVMSAHGGWFFRPRTTDVSVQSTPYLPTWI